MDHHLVYPQGLIWEVQAVVGQATAMFPLPLSPSLLLGTIVQELDRPPDLDMATGTPLLLA
jgi:hypothetical protein